MPGMQKSDPELLPVHRPRCPNCQARMITAGVLPRPDGFEHRTYECPKCAHAETRIEASDQFEFDVLSGSDPGSSQRPNAAPGSIPDNERTSQPQPKH
jgi:tRNA(Ile2) C34 agmatinyltransferase TiaS